MTSRNARVGDADNVTQEALHQMGVLAICQALHMDHTGGSDPLSDEVRSAYYAHLLGKLEFWTASRGRAARYDSAVYELIRATIAEAP